MLFWAWKLGPDRSISSIPIGISLEQVDAVRPSLLPGAVLSLVSRAWVNPLLDDIVHRFSFFHWDAA